MKCFKKQRNIKGALTLAPKSNRERVSKGHPPLHAQSRSCPMDPPLGYFSTAPVDTYVSLLFCCVGSLAFEGGRCLGFDPSA